MGQPAREGTPPVGERSNIRSNVDNCCVIRHPPYKAHRSTPTHLPIYWSIGTNALGMGLIVAHWGRNGASVENLVRPTYSAEATRAEPTRPTHYRSHALVADK